MADEETVEAGTNGEQQIEIDYSQETEEQLEARLTAGEGLVEEQIDEPGDEPAPVEEPAAEPTEPVEEVKATEETTEEVVEPVEEERNFELEEMQALVEQSKAHAAKAELERGRATGEKGHILQELAKLRQELATRQDPNNQAEDYSQPQPQYVAPGPTVDQSRLAELEADARAVAVDAEYALFLRDKGIKPEDSQATLQKMSASIQEGFQPYQSEMATMSAKSIRKALSHVLGSAYADMRLAEVQTAKAEALEKKASQVPERKKAKLAASVSGSGGAPAPKARPKSPEQMTGDEADKALIKEFGDGSYRRARR